ncbi:MAG: pyridoxamine 5'-phosphate oxidase [Rhizobacter sp.]
MNPERLTTLDAVLNAVWRELALAVRDKNNPWRTPVLATRDGEAVDARTVVLREVNADQRQVLFYTDPRAGKVRQLLAQPEAVLVLWSPQLGWQLRARVALTVQTSGLDVTSRWARVKLSPASQDYLSPHPPGARLGDVSATPKNEINEMPHAERDVFFGVITAQVSSFDWLELHPNGHRRARFDLDGSCWLQP